MFSADDVRLALDMLAEALLTGRVLEDDTALLYLSRCRRLAARLRVSSDGDLLRPELASLFEEWASFEFGA